ncbi:MaoC dehydratase-like protein [Sanguibacter antarcticus]|uniref:MaoC dehydratase-like protein n=2 Tax=Sanguibacter antarcticus TaxID=372484 RepID=A0A2A9EA54_9MICO|nr:MaoC dehydratase-like protein [Sanguibacter antarcticus]
MADMNTSSTSGDRPAHVKTLPEVPGLGGLYVRAVVPSAERLLSKIPGLGGLDESAEPGRSTVVLPDVTYRVADVVADPEHLLAYQRLLGEPTDDHLPAGFVHVLAFPVAMALMVRPDFPLPVAGMVHLANAVRVSRPVLADEHLEVQAWAENARPHRKGTQVDLVTEVSALSGAGHAREVVWRGVSTYLAKGAGSVSVVEPGAPQATASAARVADAEATTERFPTAQWQLDAGTGRRYAAVSGDRNPIHLSALTAKAFGFPKAIAHGMYTAARALSETGAGQAGAFEWTVEFAKPVLLPGKVAVAITRSESPGDGFTYVGWNARSGKEHFTGTVTPG